MHTDRQMIELWGAWAWAWACMTPLHFTSDQQQLPMHELMIFRFSDCIGQSVVQRSKELQQDQQQWVHWRLALWNTLNEHCEQSVVDLLFMSMQV